MAACTTVMFALGGCGAGYDFGAADTAAPAVPSVPAVVSRGTPVPPPAAQVLDRAPSGARLDYRLPNGVSTDVVLGAAYQSGLQVPCRMGHSGVGGSRGTYVFCRQDAQWYAMPPVVISGL